MASYFCQFKHNRIFSVSHEPHFPSNPSKIRSWSASCACRLSGHECSQVTCVSRTSHVRQRHEHREPHSGHPCFKHSNLEFMCISCSYKFRYWSCCSYISAVALLLQIITKRSPCAHHKFIRDSGGTAPLIGTKRMWLVTFKLRRLYHLENTPVPTE